MKTFAAAISQQLSTTAVFAGEGPAMASGCCSTRKYVLCGGTQAIPGGMTCRNTIVKYCPISPRICD